MGLLTALGVGAALLAPAGCGSGAGSGGAAPASGPQPATASPAGAPAARAASNGPYPAPREETYQSCPPRGQGGDSALNLRKNRVDTGAWQSVSLRSLLSLTWPQGVVGQRRDTWPSSDATAVARDEGRPVVTEGYVLKVRHEGPESPNCDDPSARDYHVWLAASPSDTRASSMIVELAPRVVALNPAWGGESTLLRLAGHHLRVSGWLMLDQEHPDQLQQTRGTLWEIHPVMRIAVDQNGTWADLASGQVALGPVSRSRGAGGYGRGRSGGYGYGYGYVPSPSHHYRYHPRRHRRHEYSY